MLHLKLVPSLLASAPTDNIVQHWRTTIPDNPPAPMSLRDGQLSLEQADPVRLWMGVPTFIDPTGRRLVFDADKSGSNVSVSDVAPATPKPGDLWFDSVGTQLYVWFQDPTSAAWVAASNAGGGAGGAGITDDAPSNGTTYGRMNAAWTRVLAITGDVLDGGNF